MENWTMVSSLLPPQNEIVETKVDDASGIRNVQKLKLNGRLWWHPDGSMYVYYEPTHWRKITK